MGKLLSLNGNNNSYTIAISDDSVESSKLIELYEKTTANINASEVNVLNGKSSDLKKVYSSSRVIGLGDETLTISDTLIDASLLNILDGITTGKINASTVTKLTGSESEINSVISSGGISDGESTFPLWLSYLESLKYLASHEDLINAFGLNADKAKLHYINYGRAEGRSLNTFNSSQYLNNYSDLRKAFGESETSALEHYLQYGYKEGRRDSSNKILESENSTISLTDFQALNYIASHIDLISAFSNNLEAAYNLEAAKSHYTNYGKSEGRSLDDFDEWGYLASNNDLLHHFGSKTKDAIKHYITYGKSEGRSTNLFNANSYLNNYADLKNAFGNNQELAKKHFVEYGFNEGRLF